MDELRRKLELLEEQDKVWRAQQNEIEKRIQLDYERKLKKLDEDYERAVEEIDLKFNARKKAIILNYCGQSMYEKSVDEEEQMCSDKTKSHAGNDGAVCLGGAVSHQTATHQTQTYVSKDKSIEIEPIDQALQSTSYEAATVVHHPDHRTNLIEYIGFNTIAEDRGGKELVHTGS
ncbi:uncharacterized protein LOC134214204 [Armigeres subalbatus]|uniref:uncharacterized protein LOC134214204 n=1 Tax=Armigeres subalbatus TaxID=124917 RepID=UPI002ED44F48